MNQHKSTAAVGLAALALLLAGGCDLLDPKKNAALTDPGSVRCPYHNWELCNLPTSLGNTSPYDIALTMAGIPSIPATCGVLICSSDHATALARAGAMVGRTNLDSPDGVYCRDTGSKLPLPAYDIELPPCAVPEMQPEDPCLKKGESCDDGLLCCAGLLCGDSPATYTAGGPGICCSPVGVGWCATEADCCWEPGGNAVCEGSRCCAGQTGACTSDAECCDGLSCWGASADGAAVGTCD